MRLLLSTANVVFLLSHFQALFLQLLPVLCHNLEQKRQSIVAIVLVKLFKTFLNNTFLIIIIMLIINNYTRPTTTLVEKPAHKSL